MKLPKGKPKLTPEQKQLYKDVAEIKTTRNWPLYWFATLEKAVAEGDHEAAAEAQRELARLGVRVNYGKPQGIAHEDQPL